MASTGLLGINPYQKGVVFDISSRPINLAIQLEQKEAAKREALDKYYMDYEKSLNPAGMRGQDQNVFLSKLNGAKSYFLQNRDAILNPSKYGAEAQSTYLAQLKDAQSIIEQSKQEAANEKADREHYRRAVEQGLDIPEGYLDAVASSNLPLGHRNRVSLDPYKWNFFKPHNDVDFNKSTWGLVKPTEVTETVFEKDAKGKSIPTKAKDIITLKVSPQDIALAEQSAINYVHQNPGTYNLVSKMLKDPIKKAQLENVYASAHPELIKFDATGKIISKPTISSIDEAAAAYSHLFNPSREKKEGKIYNPIEWQNRADYASQLSRKNMRYQKALGLGDMSDPIQDYVNSARTGQTFSGEVGKGVEKLLLPEKVVQEFKTSDNKNPVIGRGINDGKYYSIQFQYNVDKNGKKTKTDLIDWTKTVEIPDVQIRGSVVNHVLPSNAKVKLTTGGSKSKKSIPGF